MTWLFGSLLEYWAPILIGSVLIIGLGIFAYVFRNWKAVAGAALIAFLLISVGVIDRRGYQRRSQEDLAAAHQIANARLITISDIQTTDAEQRRRDEEELAKLRAQIEQAPTNDSPCGDEGLPDRVRGTR